MSNKSARKVKLPPAPKTPRSLDEINQDYGRLASQLGQASYQVFVFEMDIQRMNDELRELNYEAAARNALDKKAAAPQEEEAKQPPAVEGAQ